MLVMILEKVPNTLRGELSRWLQEVRAGVFVGHVSKRVRDNLYDKCTKTAPNSGVMQIWSSDTEQRYRVRSNGLTSRDIIEHDGIKLVQVPHNLNKRANGSKIKARLKRLRETAISDGYKAP